MRSCQRIVTVVVPHGNESPSESRCDRLLTTRLRRRPLARVPARPARTSAGADFWAWRERCSPRRCARPPQRSDRVRADLPRAARGRLHGCRRVPLPRLRGGARRGGGRGGGRDRARPPPRRLRPRRLDRFRQPSVAAYLAEVESARRARDPRRPRPALRPRLPEGLAGRDRPLRGDEPLCHCTSTPASSHARSKSASPSTASPDRAARRDRVPRATHDRRPRDARRQTTSSTCSPTPAPRVCLCPTTEANLGDGYAPVERLLERGIAHLHRLRLECAHRSARGAPRARRDRSPRGPARDVISRRMPCSRSAAGTAPAALGIDGGRRSSRPRPRRSSVASLRQTSSALLCRRLSRRAVKGPRELLVAGRSRRAASR